MVLDVDLEPVNSIEISIPIDHQLFSAVLHNTMEVPLIIVAAKSLLSCYPVAPSRVLLLHPAVLVFFVGIYHSPLPEKEISFQERLSL